MTPSPQLATKKNAKNSANMRIIAKKAGVSATTVSLALRDMPSISQETKERIYAVQQSLGYKMSKRSSRSSGMDNQKLSRIIYRLKDISLGEETYLPFLHGLMAECEHRSIKLELENTGVASFITKPISNCGVVISGRFIENDLDEMQKLGMPYVVLGAYRLPHPHHMVSPNLYEAVERILDNLKAEGMRDLTIVVEDRHRSYERELLRSFWGTLVDLGMPAGPETTVELGNGFSNIEKATSTIIQRQKPGSRIIVLNQNCADVLTMELQSRHGALINGKHIVAFTAQAQPIANRYYRTFNLGCSGCAQLAVGRLVELAKDPRMVPHTSYLSVPGWY